MLRRVLTALAVFLLLPLNAHAWWNSDFTTRKKITLNTSATGVEIAADQVFVPVLVRLHTGNFGFADAKPDGADVRFVANDDKTALKYHIESFDGINELATIWVQVPKLAAKQSADYIWVYYGSDKATAGDDAKGTFDPAYATVLHLSEGTAPPKDATLNAVPVAGDAKPEKQGLIGGAYSFDGSSQLTVGPAPAFKAGGANGAALSAWVKPSAFGGNQVVIQWGGAQGLTLGLANGTPYAQAGSVTVNASAALGTGTWHHLALSVKDKLTLVVDGVDAGSSAASSPELAATATVGNNGVPAAGFKGVIDEVQFSSSARASDWFKLQAQGQDSETRLMTIGQDEQAEAAGSSYFAILLHSVTIDGWVVIGILMVMMVISWAVMFTKAQFVNRTRKGNEAFQARFAELRADALMSLDRNDVPAPGRDGKKGRGRSNADLMKHSSLYRLYHVAMRELKHRFDHLDAKGIPHTLSGPAIDAIRASLDAGTVRESQRLNSQMVLLTIAVSGGPFLGLLGTVVGVMITFAAIAAAGDVNVNAIAPGIAAALVATVAGLAVAIPALFGYNYLSIQVKNLSADMAVFNDELVTKLAETYSN
ncbi:MAG: DUF2341 domain-containing protein [Pseudomonadota bacterium]|nr:DUF2341 domain-containing protein [Pseudomonadota bacterium]